jgi:hypothetical protein
MPRIVTNHSFFYCLRTIFLCALLVGYVYGSKIAIEDPPRIDKAERQLAKRFEPEKEIHLLLKGCKGLIHIPSLNFEGKGLEIDGDQVTIVDTGGTSITGEVRSYSRSSYWMDANLGFIFRRTSVPSTSPNWQPPTIISLVLSQDRKYPKRFVLKPAQGLNTDFPTTVISCDSATASP